MKKCKQFLSVVLAFCLLLSVMPISAAAADTIITVGPSGCDFTTIGAALDSLDNGTSRVIIEIQPGNYEEQLYIDRANVTLRNASSNPSIALTNKGVDIDANAVRITHYYGHGYSYYSMGSDYLYDEDLLATNKSNGKPSVTNPGAGSATHWNASVIIAANGFIAEDIIFENSFNQYISKKAANDVLKKESGAKEGSTARTSLSAGSTTVQDKAYVERAAALAIKNNVSQVYFDHCKFVGRQDTLYGGKNVTAAFYDCEVYGACDYIFGAMTAVFAKCDLVFNTSEGSSDRGYITAAQTASGTRGMLMYNCHITSTTPGVDTASSYASKPGYFGRPWAENTGEAIFYNTIIDATCSHWSSQSKSLIHPEGWLDSLNGESKMCGEYGTYEMSGVDNSGSRETWAKATDTTADGKAVSVSTFLGSWNPFSGEDMTITMPDGTVTEPENTQPSNPSGGDEGGNEGGGSTVPAGEYVHIFQDSGKTSSFYTITGDGTSTSKGSATVNGTTYNTCFKMNSAATITFNAPTAGTFTMVFNTGSAGKTINVNSTTYTIPSDGVLTAEVPAGANTVKRQSGESFVFYMVYASEESGETEPTEAPHTHSYTSSVTTAATCGAAGVRTFTCSCGHSYTETIAATGNHSYANGSCTVCGAKDPNYVAPTEPSEPDETEPSQPSVPVDPQPPVTGSQYIHNFTDDGFASDFFTFAGGQITNGKHGTYTYDFGNGTETLDVALKFDSGGSVTFTPDADGTVTIAVGSQSAGRGVVINNGSSDIGEIDIDTANKLFVLTVDVSANTTYTVKRTSGESGLYYIAYASESTGGDVHTHSYEAVVTDPTCTAAGFTTYTCSCGDSYVGDEVAATGHNHEVSVTAPTCTADGSRVYTCACGDTYSEVIPATGHDYEAVVTAPTCEDDGYTTYTCACGDSYVGDEVAATGHSYESVKVDATCESDGSITYTCACGDTYSETIPATGHTNAAAVEENRKEATCTVDGSYDTVIYCSVCGAEVSRVTTAIPATGHDYKAVVTAPTCTAQGYTTYTCACGDSYVADYVAATGHSYEAVVTAPGCEIQGYTTYTCACGDSYVADYVDALKHSYSADGICLNCGEEDPNATPPLFLFSIAGSNMSLGNDLTMYFYVNASDLSGSDYYMQITKTYADGRGDVVRTYDFAEWVNYGTMYRIGFNGIAAKEMMDKIHVTVYHKDGTIASYTKVMTIAEYAVNVLNDQSPSSVACHTLMADMLNYGAAAQKGLNYNTGKLASDMMTETHKSYATKNFSMDQFSNKTVKGPGFLGGNLTLVSNICMNLYFDQNLVDNTMTARVSYTDHNNKKVSYEIPGSEFFELGGYGFVGVEIDSMVAADAQCMITVEIVDGSEVVASVSTSVESMAVVGYANTPLYVDLMTFCTSAYKYFHN